jgi:hypothetical protein
LEARAALELSTKNEAQSEKGIQANMVAEDSSWEEDSGDSSGRFSYIHVDFIGLSH